MQSLNLNQINVLIILFMVNQIFTGEGESVEVNKVGNFEVFKEKLYKRKQKSVNNQILQICLNELESEESAAERINQPGKGLKILTPNQMLSRLPITLAQLKQEIILKNLRMKLDNYCILCTDQKNLQSNSIKVWLTLFKNENNL